MREPPEIWDEARLKALSPAEHDFQEFKGSGWVLDGRKIAAHFQPAMSKQISAFSNASGGRLYIGIDDNGIIDGGLNTQLKGGGTRAWLEDIISSAVEPPLPSYNVFEVQSEGEGSLITPGCAVYVVEIVASNAAPHMAIDRRYYLRIAGKSRPMGHVHIQDILRRTRHPRVRLARIGPYGRAELDLSDPRGPMAFICLQTLIANQGHTLAHHVGAEISVPRSLVSSEVRARTLADGDILLTQRPGVYTFFRYHPTPVFPSQELQFTRIWVGLHARNLGFIRSGAVVRWKVFADDAPPAEGEQILNRFNVVRKALKAIENHLKS